MKKLKNTQKILLVFGALLFIGAALWWTNQYGSASNERDRDVVHGLVKVKVPLLSVKALAGKKVFDRSCQQCHGVQASGSDKGPPLIHSVYNPGHHSNIAFFSAVKKGSRQHHWQFGDMPPQPNVTEQEVTRIIDYIRELQDANGIVNKPHQM